MIELKGSLPNEWQLEGELDKTAIPIAWTKLQAERPTHGDWQIDISGVTRYDSAGIAFLIGLLRHATQQGISLRLLKLHPNALELIKAQGLMALFEGVIV